MSPLGKSEYKPKCGTYLITWKDGPEAVRTHVAIPFHVMHAARATKDPGAQEQVCRMFREAAGLNSKTPVDYGKLLIGDNKRTVKA